MPTSQRWRRLSRLRVSLSRRSFWRSMMKWSRHGSDGLGNLSAAAETPVRDSNVANLRQHVDGIGVARLASAGRFHLSRKSVEIRTRNCLHLERLAFLN